eukprot:CAMPEP_0173086820 /NCGR_PEP_ID=MMETSP1102-20130122/23195_1 /TAXON_ID=49646 /ORGANISM="Geminigera sp., Strain Caron Lab Isolate" /LENGTH=204 /DNA_ID=CAMNT_0013967863 /DNA_START=418 /DNA_END=1032 /DNA_ORIENTATION=+
MREKAFESYLKGKWSTILAASSTLNASSTEMFFSATKNLTTVTKKNIALHGWFGKLPSGIPDGRAQIRQLEGTDHDGFRWEVHHDVKLVLLFKSIGRAQTGVKETMTSFCGYFVNILHELFTTGRVTNQLDKSRSALLGVHPCRQWSLVACFRKQPPGFSSDVMFLDALGNADRSAHSRWVALDPTKNLRLETTHARDQQIGSA